MQFKDTTRRKLSFGEIAVRLNNLHLPQVDLVVGIAEGGVVPASMAAFKLGTDLHTVKINYRDEGNTPRYDQPKVFSNGNSLKNKKILIVDDVSVTGKTLEKAKELFEGNEILTLTFKGKADYVLFPEISECVHWPWKLTKQSEASLQ